MARGRSPQRGSDPNAALESDPMFTRRQRPDDPDDHWEVRTIPRLLRPKRQPEKPKAVRPEDVRVVRKSAGKRAEGLAPGPGQAEALARKRAEQGKKGQDDG